MHAERGGAGDQAEGTGRIAPPGRFRALPSLERPRSSRVGSPNDGLMPAPSPAQTDLRPTQEDPDRTLRNRKSRP